MQEATGAAKKAANPASVKRGLLEGQDKIVNATEVSEEQTAHSSPHSARGILHGCPPFGVSKQVAVNRLVNHNMDGNFKVKKKAHDCGQATGEEFAGYAPDQNAVIQS